MTTRPDRRLRADGHRFLLRRMECALLQGDPGADPELITGPRLWFAAGAGITVLIAAGVAAVPLLWPA